MVAKVWDVRVSRAFVAQLVAAAAVVLLTVGCGVDTASVNAPEEQASTLAPMTGTVMGGQQPVSGATITLYAVSTSGTGFTSTSLMTGTVLTGTDGTYSLAGKINATTCSSTSTTEVYVVASGGNPGLSGSVNNPQLKMMTGIGTCASLYAVPAPKIEINELTTVATVAALLPYFGTGTTGYNHVGSTVANEGALAAAMSTVTDYVDTTQGSTPGTTLPTGYSVPTATLISLANSVVPCINSTGGVANDGTTPCGSLLGLANASGGTAPTDAVTALVNILRYPESSVSAIFGLAGTFPPYQTALPQAPGNWSLPIVAASGASIQFANPTYAVQEGISYVTVTVTTSNGNNAATVQYQTAGGTAVAGTDYTTTSGTLTWAAGDSTSRTITLTLANAGIASGSHSFNVELYSPQGGVSLGTNASTTVTMTGNALASQVAGVSTGTQAGAIQRAALNWWLNAAYTMAANGDSTDSNNLISDINNALTQTWSVPTSLPATLYPTIPCVIVVAPCTQVNPSVTAANSSIASNLSSDASTPAYLDVAYSSAGTTGTQLQNGENMLSALLTQGQSYYLSPSLVPAILTRIENATYTINATSDWNDIDSDTEMSVMYMMLTQGWAQIVPPSRQAVWKSVIATETSYEISDNSSHLTKEQTNSDLANNWINSDVRHVAAIEYGEMIAGTTSTATPYLQGGLVEMEDSLLPDGGTNYTDQQNEAFTYHPIYVRELSRYSQITGDPTGYYLAQATQYYTPLSLMMPDVGEDVTAPSWKKYWNENNDQEAMMIVSGLPVYASGTSAYSARTSSTGNQILVAQLQSVGYPASYYDAAYYNPNVAAANTPSNWITYDANAEGPRGVQNGLALQGVSGTPGGWMYIGTTRPTPVSDRGKATFVGSVLVTSTTSGAGWTLDSAVESAGAVVLKANGAELVTTNSYGANSKLYNDAQNEFNASTTTSRFGALSTTHTLSGYETMASTWVQNEAWVLLPTRVIGLVTVSNTATESAFELDAGFKLVSGRDTWGTQKTWSQLSSTMWQYGNTVIQVYANDFAGSRTELTGTWEDNANKAGWLLMTDANNSTTTAHTFPAGTSHTMLSDFRPQGSSAATNVQQLTGLPTGLIGFSFTDNGVNYTMVMNTTSAAIPYTATSGTVTMSGALYRAPFIDPNATESVPSATYAGSVPANSHIVITQ